MHSVPGKPLHHCTVERDHASRRRPSRFPSPITLPYGVLANTAPDEITTIDAETRILSVNSATERIFGWCAAEMVGKPLTIIMPADHVERYEAGMHRYLASPASNN